jgi:hypothetical protein
MEVVVMYITLSRSDFKSLQDGAENPNYSAFDDLLIELTGMSEDEAAEIDEFEVKVERESTRW